MIGPVAFENFPESSAPVHHRSLGNADCAIILLLLVLGAFQIATFQRLESFGSDSSIYMGLARNLLETGRYEFNYKPHTLYPPGFPVLLASISLLTGRGDYGVFIRFMPVFSTLALVVWYFVLKQAAGRFAAGASCLLVATSAPLFEMVTRCVCSDVPFFLVSGLALWCLMYLDRQAVHRPAQFLLFMCAVLFTAAAVLIRSVGISLCAGMLVWSLAAPWHRGPRRQITLRAAVSAALLGFLIFAAWIGWSKRSEQLEYKGQHMGSYASQFVMKDPHRPGLGKASVGELILRMASNMPVQSSHIAALLTRINWVAPIWYSPLTMIPLALLLFGLMSCVCDDRGTLLAGYFLAYFAVFLLWPFDEGPRFMLPLAPLAFVLIWRGLVAVGHLLQARPATTLAFISVLATALAGGVRPHGARIAGPGFRSVLAESRRRTGDFGPSGQARWTN